MNDKNPVTPSGAPFPNCKYQICDLPGQCIGEGACHHPKETAAQQTPCYSEGTNEPAIAHKAGATHADTVEDKGIAEHRVPAQSAVSAAPTPGANALPMLMRTLNRELLDSGLVTVEQWNAEIAPRLSAVALYEDNLENLQAQHDMAQHLLAACTDRNIILERTLAEAKSLAEHRWDNYVLPLRKMLKAEKERAIKAESELAAEKKLSEAISRDCNDTANERNQLRSELAAAKEQLAAERKRADEAESRLATINRKCEGLYYLDDVEGGRSYTDSYVEAKRFYGQDKLLVESKRVIIVTVDAINEAMKSNG